MVVMCAWLFDIALAAVFNAGRFDLGFYAGRIYGLLAASFVLMVLLLENGDRKSTRLNSSHLVISYAVFCLKKKNYSSSRLVWIRFVLDSRVHVSSTRS